MAGARRYNEATLDFSQEAQINESPSKLASYLTPLKVDDKLQKDQSEEKSIS